MSYNPKIYTTVVHMLSKAAADFGDATAIVCEDRQLTYNQYLRCVSGLARRLQDFVQGQSLRGERIALICANSIEIAIGLFAGHASGGQIVPINPIFIYM